MPSKCRNWCELTIGFIGDSGTDKDTVAWAVESLLRCKANVRVVWHSGTAPGLRPIADDFDAAFLDIEEGPANDEWAPRLVFQPIDDDANDAGPVVRIPMYRIRSIDIY